MASFFGDAPKTEVHQAPGSPPDPGYAFAKWLFGQLPGLMRQPYPTYPGQVDPGLSPTLQDVIRRAQGFAESSPNELLQGVQGGIGRFMSPSFINPWNRLFGGAPDYFGVDPNQRVFGGRPAGDMTYQAGGQPPPGTPGTPSSMPWSPTGGTMWAPSPGSQDGQGAPGGGAPTSRMAAYQAASAQFNPSWAGSTDPNVFNSQPFLDYNRQFQQKPFHSTDYQSAMERISGRPVSQQEATNAWMGGDTGIIDQGRKLFMQDSPAQFTGSNQRLSDLITQHGVAAGSRMFDQEMGGR